MKRKTVFLIYADGSLIMITGVFSLETFPMIKLVQVTGIFGRSNYSMERLVSLKIRTEGGSK